MVISDSRLILSQLLGPSHGLSGFAQRMVDVAQTKLDERSDELANLEKLINPLLDDNDQVI